MSFDADGLVERTVEVDGEALFVRLFGVGPPVLLLHGFPQTSMMWHRLAPRLAGAHTLVIPDLPGYGRSAAPAGGPERYAKRRLAKDMAGLMAALGHDRFAVVGHDRGGRVGYRMALDHPELVAALAVLDIVPTGAVWADFSAERALAFYHWLFLAQPAPLPESLIGHDPAGYLDMTMARWTKAKDLSAFAPAALAEYRTAFGEPQRIAAACDDYRAGATLDRAHDDASVAAGDTIGCPTLVLWGDAFHAGGGRPPIDVWRSWAPRAHGSALDCGHFLPEEDPDGVLARLAPFLRENAGG